ncbi:MAG: acyl-CoA/acyl-ACP dehydrogenase [Saprospiraceae bacterium]|nr:acyl-CoA/acyl-ACP dehydrogenase [Saprospiraceae bacterium]
MIKSIHQHNDLIARAKSLAKEKFFSRAEMHDEKAAFPKQNFDDLKEASFLAVLAGQEFGGEGINHSVGNINTQWQITKEFAKADMAFARCWEGHSNAVLLIDKIANEDQKKRWFRGIKEKGDIWTAWSGEPQVKKPGQKMSFGTQIQEVENGYIVSGTKIFCTSAPGANWSILFVSPTGPGGARHNSGDSDVIMLACDLSDSSIEFDDSWWKPIGMKASVSYLVRFNETFIPRENLMGYPGQYLKEKWQVKITPQYAATFLGGAEAAFEYALNYVKKQNRESDPYVQHRIAHMAMHIDTCNLWLEKTSNHWGSGEIEQAELASNCARYFIEKLTTEVIQHAIHVCGARSMIKPSPLERIHRDISFYTRHDNHDQVLSTIGKSILGELHDVSFFNGEKTENHKNNILFNPKIHSKS